MFMQKKKSYAPMPPSEFDTSKTHFQNVISTTAICKDRSCPLPAFIEFVSSFIKANPETFSIVFAYLARYTDQIGNPVTSIQCFTVRANKWRASTLQDIADGSFADIWGEDYEAQYEIEGSAILTTHVTFWSPCPGGTQYQASRIVNACGMEYHISTIEYETDECFFGLFSKSLTKQEISDIKDVVCYEPNTKVSLEYAKDILEAMQLMHYSFRLSMPDVLLNAEGQTEIKCMLYDSHYWFIDETREEIEIEVESTSKFFAYDFETVSRDGRTYPIVFSYATECEEGCIATEDPLNEPLSERIMTIFAKFCKLENRRPVSFNGSNFDDLLLFRELPPDTINAIKGNGNSILWFSIFGKKSFDVAKFVKTSLKKACEAFGVEGKFENPDFDALNREFREGSVTITQEMRKYAIQDARCLFSLTQKLHQLFMTLDINIFANISIAQCAMSLMKKHLKKMGSKLWQIDDLEQHAKLRGFMNGGKCHGEIGLHNFEEDLNLYDVNSMYPHFMTTERFILNASNLVSTQDLVWHGFYSVLVTKQATVCCMPARKEDGTLDWDPKIPYASKGMGISLEDHVMRGGEYVLVEGLKFEHIETSSEMFEWMQNLIKLKETATVDCLRNMYKLLINSMSGKLTQAPITEQIKLSRKVRHEFVSQIRTYEEGAVYGMISKLPKPVCTGSLVNGMLVYEYARRQLNAHIAESDNFVYCDTDSVVTTSKLSTSSVLGALKLEQTMTHCLCNGKKMYVLFDDPHGALKNSTLSIPEKLKLLEKKKCSLKGFGRTGIYENDDEQTENWMWMLRAYLEKATSVTIDYQYCKRTKMMPHFQDLPKVYTNFVGLE